MKNKYLMSSLTCPLLRRDVDDQLSEAARVSSQWRLGLASLVSVVVFTSNVPISSTLKVSAFFNGK